MFSAADLDTLNWERDGGDWPNASHSRFVDAGGLRWHVQEFGEGDTLLLFHGAGAATHSWRDLAPLLGRRAHVLAVDLPGHGFSSRPPAEQLTLPGVADAVAALLAELALQPRFTIGHSAGAALALFMTLSGLLAPDRLISLNGAHLPLRGFPAWLYSPIARFISESRNLPRWFAWRARNRRVVENLMNGTGSRLDERGLNLYWKLARSPSHVSAALGLMAGWDVRIIDRELSGLARPITLITGDNDLTVPPADSLRVRERVADAHWISQPGLGHLAHEERPEETAELIVQEIGLAAETTSAVVAS
jgi:magnesium chelatase accessory protein